MVQVQAPSNKKSLDMADLQSTLFSLGEGAWAPQAPLVAPLGNFIV